MVIGACSPAPPEQSMSVVTAEGHLAPLDSVTMSYDVQGLRVIQRPNYANDAVAVNLYLLGGTRQLTAATQGIEALLLHTGEYGTLNYPGGAWRAAWGLTGSRIVVAPDADWTIYGFRGVRQEFDSSWAAFADRLMHPVLGSASIGIVRARLIAANRAATENPDSYVMRFSDSVAFAGHPYGLSPGGTEATLASLDSANLARYLAAQMVKSRMLLVVVGNVSRQQVESAVTRTLATLPAGSYAWTLPAEPPEFRSTVNFKSRSIPTNYVVGTFRGPPAGSRDAAAFRVALALLSSGMNQSIREERGLSYAASAIDVERGATSGVLYVSSSAPHLVMPIIWKQVAQMRDFPQVPVTMRSFTDQFIMEYFGNNMTNAAQADFIARAQLYQGDYHKASASMAELRNVTASNVHYVARQYLQHMQFVYLGDTSRVQRSDFATF